MLLRKVGALLGASSVAAATRRLSQPRRGVAQSRRSVALMPRAAKAQSAASGGVTDGGAASGGVTVGGGGEWRSLGTNARELRLDNTLPTGQSFRWRKTVGGVYVGVIGARVVSMRQEEVRPDR